MLGIDIRIQTAVLRNPKIRKLIHRLGGDGFVSLLRVWCYAREEKTEGILDDMTFDEVEAIVAEWRGIPGEFIKAARDLHLIEEVDGHPAIHDWAMNQPWAIKATDRVETARRNAMAGVAKRSAIRSANGSAIRSANGSAIRSADSPAPDLTCPDLYLTKNKTPPPPFEGGEDVIGSASPRDPDGNTEPSAALVRESNSETQDRADGEADPIDETPSPNGSGSPSGRTDRPDRTGQPERGSGDPSVERVRVRYAEVITTGHPCSDGSARAAIARTIAEVAKSETVSAKEFGEEGRKERQRERIAARLVAAVDRYARSAVYLDAEPLYHKTCANFFASDKHWRLYDSDDAPAMKAKRRAAKPRDAPRPEPTAPRLPEKRSCPKCGLSATVKAFGVIECKWCAQDEEEKRTG